MIFKSQFSVDVPQVDVLSFLFEQTPFREDDSIWISPYDASLSITLSQARSLTTRIGHGLRSLDVGTKEGVEDIVLTFVDNQVMCGPAMFGVICAGAVHSTCPFTATAFELCRQIKLSSPKILICSPMTRKVAEEAISLSGMNIRLLVMTSKTGACDIEDANGNSILTSATFNWKRITSQELLEGRTACLVFSSGTTGPPKGKADR